MVSLSERYRRGEYKAVWRELDHSWIDVIRFRVPEPSPADVEDVMRQTFERVARNVDRLIERLRDIGYAFECEREDDDIPAAPPRKPVDESLFTDAKAALAKRFDGKFRRPDVPTPGLPEALVWFGRIVGEVDLRQRSEEPRFSIDSDLVFKHLEVFAKEHEGLDLTAEDRETKERYLEMLGVSTDPSLLNAPETDPNRLGDFDPLVVNFGYLAYDIAAPENEPLLTPDGGIGLQASFAPSFEHKAEVSGAINYHIYLPSERRDPIVFAEAVRLPFTDYLRRCFARGGFYGVPRRVRENTPMQRAVEPKIWLPQNPIFETLAADMIRF